MPYSPKTTVYQWSLHVIRLVETLARLGAQDQAGLAACWALGQLQSEPPLLLLTQKRKLKKKRKYLIQGLTKENVSARFRLSFLSMLSRIPPTFSCEWPSRHQRVVYCLWGGCQRGGGSLGGAATLPCQSGQTQECGGRGGVRLRRYARLAEKGPLVLSGCP